MATSSLMALGLDFFRVDLTYLPRVRRNSGMIFTPTVFRLIALGCAATLEIGDDKCESMSLDSLQRIGSGLSHSLILIGQMSDESRSRAARVWTKLSNESDRRQTDFWIAVVQ